MGGNLQSGACGRPRERGTGRGQRLLTIRPGPPWPLARPPKLHPPATSWASRVDPDTHWLPSAMTDFAIFGGVDHRGTVGKVAPGPIRPRGSLLAHDLREPGRPGDTLRAAG